MLLAVSLLAGWVGQALAISAAKKWSFQAMLLGNWAVPAGGLPAFTKDGLTYPGYHNSGGYGVPNNPNQGRDIPPSAKTASQTQPYTPAPPITYPA